MEVYHFECCLLLFIVHCCTVARSCDDLGKLSVLAGNLRVCFKAQVLLLNNQYYFKGKMS